MRQEILKRIERLEREKALKNARMMFLVCKSDDDVNEQIASLGDFNNITYVVLQI